MWSVSVRAGASRNSNGSGLPHKVHSSSLTTGFLYLEQLYCTNYFRNDDNMERMWAGCHPSLARTIPTGCPLGLCVIRQPSAERVPDVGVYSALPAIPGRLTITARICASTEVRTLADAHSFLPRPRPGTPSNPRTIRQNSLALRAISSLASGAIRLASMSYPTISTGLSVILIDERNAIQHFILMDMAVSMPLETYSMRSWRMI